MSDKTAFAEGYRGTERPDGCEDDHLEYLDELRESGSTMFGARPYLMSAFPELSGEQAAGILGYWMMTLGRKDR